MLPIAQVGIRAGMFAVPAAIATAVAAIEAYKRYRSRNSATDDSALRPSAGLNLPTIANARLDPAQISAIRKQLEDERLELISAREKLQSDRKDFEDAKAAVDAAIVALPAAVAQLQAGQAETQAQIAETERRREAAEEKLLAIQAETQARIAESERQRQAEGIGKRKWKIISFCIALPAAASHLMRLFGWS